MQLDLVRRKEKRRKGKRLKGRKRKEVESKEKEATYLNLNTLSPSPSFMLDQYRCIYTHTYTYILDLEDIFHTYLP